MLPLLTEEEEDKQQEEAKTREDTESDSEDPSSLVRSESDEDDSWDGTPAEAAKWIINKQPQMIKYAVLDEYFRLFFALISFALFTTMVVCFGSLWTLLHPLCY